jgi:hypothetical protein
MFVAFANLISRTLCHHHNIIKADGRILFVACMKCGHASHGIVTG